MKATTEFTPAVTKLVVDRPEQTTVTLEMTVAEAEVLSTICGFGITIPDRIHSDYGRAARDEGYRVMADLCIALGDQLIFGCADRWRDAR